MMKKETESGRIVFEIRKEKIKNGKRMLEFSRHYDTDIEDNLVNFSFVIKEGPTYIIIEVHSA